MHCSLVGIQEVMRWYENETEYHTLMLFLAGHEKDYKFFKSILDNKETLSVLSGQNIAILLFSNRISNSIIVKDRGKGLVIPGDLLEQKQNMFTVDNIPNEISEDNIIKNSITITNDICDYFGISNDSLPSVLLVDRYNINNPLMIRTKGVEDIRNIRQLLRDTNRIIENYYDIDNEIRGLDAEFKIIENKRRNINRERIKKEEKISEVLAEIRILKDKIKRFLINNYDIEIKKIERLLDDDYPLNLEKSFSETVEESILVIDKKKIILSKTYSNRINTIMRQRRKIIRDEKYRVETIKSPITNEDIARLEQINDLRIPEIYELVNTYERKFNFQGRKEDFMSFMYSLVGYTKHANELMSFRSNLR